MKLFSVLVTPMYLKKRLLTASVSRRWSCSLPRKEISTDNIHLMKMKMPNHTYLMKRWVLTKPTSWRWNYFQSWSHLCTWRRGDSWLHQSYEDEAVHNLVNKWALTTSTSWRWRCPVLVTPASWKEEYWLRYLMKMMRSDLVAPTSWKDVSRIHPPHEDVDSMCSGLVANDSAPWHLYLSNLLPSRQEHS